MALGELRVNDDVSEGDWIAARLGGAFGAVTRAVPRGFAAYVRICHPPSDPDGRSVSWRTVARHTGRWAHSVMQWHALVGSADALNATGSLWPGQNPQRGNLAPALLAPLCDVLADHAATPERCFFCLWEGWGWVETSSISAERSSGAMLHLPDRDYLLLDGPLHAALQLGDWYGPEAFAAQSPNLFWPADRTWCVASEIDFDSTLIGGSTELVEAILRAPELDAWSVQPDDSLAHDADRLNSVP
jgi:hypothetical protein